AAVLCRFRVLLANPSRALHHASETHEGCLPSRPAPQDQDSRLGDAAGTLHCKPPTPSCRLPLPRCRTMQRPGWTKGSLRSPNETAQPCRHRATDVLPSLELAVG